MGQMGFWDNPELAQRTIERLKLLKSTIDPIEETMREVEDLCTLWDLAGQEKDVKTMQEVADSLEKVS